MVAYHRSPTLPSSQPSVASTAPGSWSRHRDGPGMPHWNSAVSTSTANSTVAGQ